MLEGARESWLVRLATIRTSEGTRTVRVEGDEAFEISGFDDTGALLRDPGWRDIASRAGGRSHAVRDLDLAPLVPHPSKIICLGLNYRAHIEETGRDTPQHPTLFAKFARALIGARDDVVIPKVSETVDWEVELAFVIGSTVRHASVVDGAEAIAGYTIMNDVSVRDYQNRTLQWLQGKTFEGTTPVGPWLTTPDEVDDARDLSVICEVDGEVMQKARTSDLVFAPAEIVSYISGIVTLDPGDLIATGTPAGVGMARNPPVWLKPGQILRSRIEGLGELVNRCVKEE